MSGGEAGERVDRGRRTAWLVVAGVTALVVVSLLVSTTVLQYVGHTDSVRYRYAAAVRTVEIDAAVERVTVLPGPPGEVTVVSHRFWTYQAPDTALRADGDTYRIGARCEGGIKWFGARSCVEELDVRVPPGTGVRFRGSSDTLRVRGLTGDLDAMSGSGAIVIDGVSGRVAAEVGSGSVVADGLRSRTVVARAGSGSVDLRFARPPENVTANTASGSVTVRLPGDGARYRVATSTGSGSIDVPAVFRDPASARLLRLSTGSGHIAVLPASAAPPGGSGGNPGGNP